jgi:hypothetical protein
MKLKKTEIVEYIVAFVGIVGVLAYIHATAEPHQSVRAAQIAPIMIHTGWTIRAHAGHSVLRFPEAAPAIARVEVDQAHVPCSADRDPRRALRAQIS